MVGESVVAPGRTAAVSCGLPPSNLNAGHEWLLSGGHVATLGFAGDRVEIWTASSAPGRDPLRHAVLNQDDRDEIAQVRHEATRNRKLAARVALRFALSHAADGEIPPSAWRFEKTVNGRPLVAADLPLVRFSVSHTDGLSAIAVSRTRPVGIDIEAEPCCADPEFIQSFLSTRERAGLARLSQTERAGALLKLWTLKEAYAKLVGTGLAADLRSFEFDLDPPRLLSGCEAAEKELATRFKLWRSPSPRGFCHLALAVGQPQIRRQP
jgi:4'-phosphopantetheinyl transferase